VKREPATKKERRKKVSKAGKKEKNPAPTERPQGDVAEGMGVGNVEKIRDILFGAQMRDYEKRFARMEKRLQDDLADLRDDTGKRFASLENYIKKEIESLHDATKLLEKKLGKTGEKLSSTARDLRRQILDQSKSLSDDIRKKHEEASAALDRVAQELGEDKADRAALSELFTEMAMRLTNDDALKLNLERDDSGDE
jgi:hypothetical protein